MTQPRKSETKKICLMGASSVGKTSLVKRFVEGKFDDTYRTTIGVHMDKKSVTCDEGQVNLSIWDLEGKDDLQSEYPPTYLGGAQGYMLVVDVTRPDTLDVAKGLRSTMVSHRKNKREHGDPYPDEHSEDDDLPFVLLLNKHDLLQEDLMESCPVTERAQQIFGQAVKLFKTSAKLDEQVEQAFTCLVKQMLEVDRCQSS